MGRPQEYSLWIVPPEGVYGELAALIARLSAEYDAPVFEPHVTLIGDLAVSEEDIRPKTSQLAELLDPFTVRLTTVDYLDECFRSLFIRVDPTEEIMAANQTAVALFDQAPDEVYLPHLSLMYGHYSRDTKGRIISQVAWDSILEFTADRIHLVSASSIVEPGDWHRLGKYRLDR